MDAVERVKYECKKRGISIAKLERDCGFSNGYIRNLRNGIMPADRLQRVADYLRLPMLYLLTGNEITLAKGTPVYYSDPATAQLAQEVFENPDTRLLFDAAKDARPEDIKLAADLLKRLKETNPDG